MGDIGNKDSADYTRIVGADEQFSTDVAQDQAGVNRLQTSAVVTVEDLLSIDAIPDAFFEIINTGAQGDEITISIAGTNNDPSNPDRDVPSYSKTFTIQSSEEGDEIALRDRIVNDLNGDSAFFTDALLEATIVVNRAIVRIKSRRISLEGEFYERPNSGDFSVSTTGSANIDSPFDTIISRGKSNAVVSDPQNPHKLGALKISGEVATQNRSVSSLFVNYLTDSNGNSDMTIDASTTDVVFTVDALTNQDLVVTDLNFLAVDAKIQVTNRFMDVKITNGFLLKIVSQDGKVSSFPTLIETGDFIALVSTDTKFQTSSVLDLSFQPTNPIRLVGGSNDRIEFTIRDDLTGLDFFKIAATAFRE